MVMDWVTKILYTVRFHLFFLVIFASVCISDGWGSITPLEHRLQTALEVVLEAAYQFVLVQWHNAANLWQQRSYLRRCSRIVRMVLPQAEAAWGPGWVRQPWQRDPGDDGNGSAPPCSGCHRWKKEELLLAKVLHASFNWEESFMQMSCSRQTDLESAGFVAGEASPCIGSN